MDKRNERMLEELLKLPGNDCRKPAPRWASVNIGIFLCVGCASIHRKMGTHRSRVKSVTLDDWTREQVTHMKSIGNTASNKVFNPNEAAHPPPTATGAEERDSEMEKYIRRKYEQQAFKAGGRGVAGPAPTSLNRARERDGRLPMSSSTSSSAISGENRRNPELNNVVVQKLERPKERDLPPLPLSASKTASSGSASSGGNAPPRARPTPATSRNAQTTSNGAVSVNEMFMRPAPPSPNANLLVDVSNSTSSTLPLQINSAFPNQSQSLGVPQSTMASSYNASPQGWMGSSPSGMNGMQGAMGIHGGMAQSAPSASTPGAYNPFLQQQAQAQAQSFQQPYNQSSFQPGMYASQQSHPLAHAAFQQQHQPQQFQTGFASLNPFSGMPAVSSPYGQSAGAMGMQHSQGYFAGQGQGQGQGQYPTSWNAASMGMAHNMPMGMANGQYVYHA